MPDTEPSKTKSSSFRTVELSPEGSLPDGLRMITVKSSHLRGRGDITIWIPPGHSPKNLPCTILLHGVYGSHWAWALHGEAHHTAARLIEAGTISPTILVMPSDGLWGDGSGYLAHNSGTHTSSPTQDFEQWITSDVITVIKETFGIEHTRRWGICGLSMGGYGALRLGLKYPEIFGAISAHSSITHPQQLEQFVEEDLARYQIHAPEHTLTHWLDHYQSNKNINNLPNLRFDCGKHDPLIEPNRELHQELTQRNIPHSYEEFEGEHSWDYWKLHIAKSLRFIDSREY